MSLTKPVVAIDFDGTIVENAWPEVGEFRPGAVEALKEISKFAKIVVWTCRVAPAEPDGVTRRSPALVAIERQKVREKLDSAGLYDLEVWDHRDKPWKPSAAAYVDDKAIRYTKRRGSWKAIVQKLAAICDEPHAMMYPGYKEDNGGD